MRSESSCLPGSRGIKNVFLYRWELEAAGPGPPALLGVGGHPEGGYAGEQHLWPPARAPARAPAQT